MSDLADVKRRRFVRAARFAAICAEHPSVIHPIDVPAGGMRAGR